MPYFPSKKKSIHATNVDLWVIIHSEKFENNENIQL